MFWSYLDGSGGRPLVGILGSLGVWFLTCTSVCMVQDMSSEDEQRGDRRMENALASRLLRASWLSPEGSDYSEGSTSREDGQGKGAYLCGSGVSGLSDESGGGEAAEESRSPWDSRCSGSHLDSVYVYSLGYLYSKVIVSMLRFQKLFSVIPP